MISPTPIALHRRITADLSERIRSGAWPPGHRLPFETELMAHYGCARATAHKAVRSLADAGMVERRRRAGTFVARPHVQSAVLEIPDIEAKVLGGGQTYAFRLLKRRVRPANDSGDEGRLGAKGPVLDLHGLHLAAGGVFALEHRVIDLAEAPGAAGVDFTLMSPGAWLLRHVAWSEARHEISAIDPEPSAAASLGTKGACLSVKRWTWRLGAGVTYARQLFPGDTLELVANFTPRMV